MSNNKGIHFISLGCPKNRVDAETMLAGLDAQGCQITGNLEEARTVVVNTCAFVDEAKAESIDTILEMTSLKEEGKLDKVIVTGCLSQRYPEELAKEIPEVDHFVGTAQVMVPGMIEVKDGPDKGTILSTEKTLIATGCKARTLPDLEVDGTRIMTSREALVMKEQPKSIVIVGAGAIGAEFAYFLNAFGTKVTLVEMMDQVLPVEDDEVAKVVHRSFTQSGIDCRVSTKVEGIKVLKNGVSLDLIKGDKKETLKVDSLLLAIGVVANTKDLLSAKVKLDSDRGYITVNDQYETSVKDIYAAGDIIGPPWLAHVATYEAVQAVQGMFGHGEAQRVTDFPGCTYCLPQVASLGKTEKALKEAGTPYKVGKFPFQASGKAVASNTAEGFVKLLVGEQYGEILGAHIVGADATELIAEYGLAMKLEATAEDIHGTIHAHPTMSEAMMEAAAAVFGEAIHI